MGGPIVHAACRLEEISEFHVERVANAPVIDGEVNGQPIRILLETGSVVSYITDTAAHRFQLPIRAYSDRSVLRAGGKELVQSAVIKELKIGRFVLKDYTINVIGKEIHDANGVATFQLGADFLSHFTTELDLAHGVVRLLHPKDCKLEQLAYWSASYYQINLEPFSSDDARLILQVKVNDKSMKARLVSGSAISFIRPQAARDAGVAPGGPSAEAAPAITGLTANAIPTWIGRFDKFEFGGEIIRNAQLRIGEVFPAGKARVTGSQLAFSVRAPEDVVLGGDFLQAHRLVIVPEQHVALLTYNGGPVFQLVRPDEVAPGVPDRTLPVDEELILKHQ